jgi:hypothetical protein
MMSESGGFQAQVTGAAGVNDCGIWGPDEPGFKGYQSNDETFSGPCGEVAYDRLVVCSRCGAVSKQELEP